MIIVWMEAYLDETYVSVIQSQLSFDASFRLLQIEDGSRGEVVVRVDNDDAVSSPNPPTHLFDYCTPSRSHASKLTQAFSPCELDSILSAWEAHFDVDWRKVGWVRDLRSHVALCQREKLAE